MVLRRGMEGNLTITGQAYVSKHNITLTALTNRNFRQHY
jgi:hypothetical protein